MSHICVLTHFKDTWKLFVEYSTWSGKGQCRPLTLDVQNILKYIYFKKEQIAAIFI